jgi:hypothetical protein
MEKRKGELVRFAQFLSVADFLLVSFWPKGQLIISTRSHCLHFSMHLAQNLFTPFKGISDSFFA